MLPSRRWQVKVFFFMVFAAPPLWAQAEEPDPASYIGMSIAELLDRFGTPRSVYALRGLEEWQDDVVFVYNAGDFYILKDRVWQVRLNSAYRIRSGDQNAVVYLSLGDAAFNGKDFAVFSLKGKNWPMSLRCNFDSAGKITAIFIYRSDI
ncbi:MAG: hypothetical protein LBH43_09500 [Treponema sp.]|jgi:hypothetical protein|nr:hypothetical protein [Treponema sp.]